MTQAKKLSPSRLQQKANTQTFKGRRWLRPKVIIFVVLFAAVAGYIIFRSFAANSLVMDYTNIDSANSSILCSFNVVSSCYSVVTETSGSKSSHKVMQLADGSQSVPSKVSVFATTFDKGLYRVCLVAKNTGPSPAAGSWAAYTYTNGTVSVTSVGGTLFYISPTDDYQSTACVDNIKYDGTAAGLEFTLNSTGPAFRLGSIIATKTGDLPASRPIVNCTKSISTGSSINGAISGLSAGQTLCLHGGTYSQQVRFTKSGTSSAPITITAYPGETPIIDGTNVGVAEHDGLFMIEGGSSYLVIDGLTIQHSPHRGIYNNGSHVTIKNSRILYSGDAGVITTNYSGPAVDDHYIDNEFGWNVWNNPCHAPTWNCTYDGSSGKNWESTTNHYGSGSTYGPVYFQGNNIHDGVGEGMVLGDGDQVTGNTVHDNWSVDIYMDGASNVNVSGNLIYESETARPSSSTVACGGNCSNVYRLQAIGIMLSSEGCGNLSGNMFRNNIVLNNQYGIRFWHRCGSTSLVNDTFDNNTVVNSTDGGFNFDAGSSNSNTLIRDNISIPRAGSAYSSGSSSGIVMAANLFTTRGASNDPKLPGEGTFSTDPSQYKLQATSTSAIDKGVTTSATNDFFGTARPRGTAYDIGAHEL